MNIVANKFKYITTMDHLFLAISDECHTILVVNQPVKLEEYRRLIDREITSYSARLERDVEEEYGEYSRIATGSFTSILSRGGKRLRGALVVAAHDMLQGPDQSIAIKVARIVEMMHAYLLMTDDIADRSRIRRGGPAAHILISEYHAKNHLRGDAAHFGVSIAMMSALANAHRAELDLNELLIPEKAKRRIASSLHANLVHTLHGQIQDIFIESIDQPSESDALQVVKLKTAFYTFVNPLEIGSLLADATKQEIRILKQYGLRAGISFQLEDDIMGVFSDAEQSGKSPLDDIREGKATLLMIRALEKGTPSQRQYLRAALGNPNLTNDNLTECRQIITDTGALKYVQRMAIDNTREALKQLERAPRHWRAEQVELLRELLHYIVERSV